MACANCAASLVFCPRGSFDCHRNGSHYPDLHFGWMDCCCGRFRCANEGEQFLSGTVQVNETRMSHKRQIPAIPPSECLFREPRTRLHFLYYFLNRSHDDFRLINDHHMGTVLCQELLTVLGERQQLVL